MYSTCIFCHAALEANDTIEHFPIGRRLAFDPERGRLWVICRRCRQWNLPPTEERWEAIEESERLYRDTRLRVSTDQIGLARLPSGLELVRIGRPQRPEFAAWRYGRSELRPQPVPAKISVNARSNRTRWSPKSSDAGSSAVAKWV